MRDNNYEYQSKANILCLLEDEEYKERKEALFKLVNEFEKLGIRWGLACSMNLFLRGVVDDFHDLDLIVEKDDIHKVKEVMERLGGILKATGGNGYCESNYYMHFQLKRVDVDIISGFRIITFGTKFLYNYSESEIEFIKVEENEIPLIPVEALYLLYAMMEGWQLKRRYKRVLLGKYLVTRELKFPKILENSLEGQLPAWIKREVKLIIQ